MIDGEIIENENNYNKLKSCLGYLLSRFNNSINRAVLLTDHTADSDEDEVSTGGTGKGLLLKFLSQYRKMGTIDGRNLNFLNRFMFSNYQEGQSL